MKKKQKKIKRFIVYCEPCGFKKIVDEDSLNEFFINETTSVFGGAPFIDIITKKTKKKKNVKRNIQVRCPKCGRGVSTKFVKEKSSEDEEKN
jgi:DNA-directed RNA polymerase subunit M/transcription elongation factor TFIIS